MREREKKNVDLESIWVTKTSNLLQFLETLHHRRIRLPPGQGLGADCTTPNPASSRAWRLLCQQSILYVTQDWNEVVILSGFWRTSFLEVLLCLPPQSAWPFPPLLQFTCPRFCILVPLLFLPLPAALCIQVSVLLTEQGPSSFLFLSWSQPTHPTPLAVSSASVYSPHQLGRVASKTVCRLLSCAGFTRSWTTLWPAVVSSRAQHPLKLLLQVSRLFHEELTRQFA